MEPINLERLNSATKYPSILTYHKLDPSNGRLSGETNTWFVAEDCYVTEKIDGTNVRIIVMPDGDYFIGSRENLLYAKGDRIGDPAQTIVANTRDLADRLASETSIRYGIGVVLFGELFGGKVGAAAKQYKPNGSTGFRLFDVMALPRQQIASMESRDLAAWRDAGGQGNLFSSVTAITALANSLGLDVVPDLNTSPPPIELEETMAWLQQAIKRSHVADADAYGNPEGVVVRTNDRKSIAKIRFEDYRRTLKAIAKAK
ncbi:MAG: RNA ligase family protein [Tepidisphaeraceae bacterium]